MGNRTGHNRQNVGYVSTSDNDSNQLVSWNYMRSIWPSPGFANQISGATCDFVRNYNDMRTANTIGADKPSHGYEDANSYKVYRPTDTGSTADGGCTCK
ncbi:hypothetical protein HPQ68_20875 [Massilia sp. erpn]|nr:hypothetical protein HPQ68_20875 [Massilia sp. erpn]